MRNLLLVLVAMAGGAAAAMQAQFTGTLDRRLGSLESVFITYFSGGMVIALIMLLARGGGLGAWREAPWYAFTSGLLGLVVIGALAITVNRLGLVTALVLFTAFTFTVSGLMSQFGWLGTDIRALDIGRLAGLAMLALGTWLVIR
jgi:bacterial/archaeal transporter family-2 protein